LGAGRNSSFHLKGREEGEGGKKGRFLSGGTVNKREVYYQSKSATRIPGGDSPSEIDECEEKRSKRNFPIN